MDLASLEASLQEGLSSSATATASSSPPATELPKSSGFSLNTMVLMFNGEVKPIHTLVKGDQLMGDDNTPRSVVGIETLPCSSFHCIKQKKGSDYIINKDNFISLKLSRVKNPLIPTVICEKKYMKNDIVDIRLQDYIQLNKSRKRDLKACKVAINFPSQPLKFDPYTFGLWIVDATESDISEISIPDLDILVDVSKDLDMQHIKLDFIRDNRFKLILASDTKSFVEEILKPLGIEDTKFIPSLYKINDRDTRLKILAGVMDCLGFYNKSCFELTVKNEKVVDDIIFIVLSLGLYASKTELNNGYYRVIISGDLSIIPTKSQRLVERKQIKDILHTGFSVIALNDINECIKISVDGNGRFLLSDFTVTHS